MSLTTYPIKKFAKIALLALTAQALIIFTHRDVFRQTKRTERSTSDFFRVAALCRLTVNKSVQQLVFEL
jgi:hypothetical protein